MINSQAPTEEYPNVVRLVLSAAGCLWLCMPSLNPPAAVQANYALSAVFPGPINNETIAVLTAAAESLPTPLSYVYAE